METFAFIDLYCERTAPGFWNEPVNAVSNAAFVAAALFAWRESQKCKTNEVDIWHVMLIVLAGLIGVGSFLFHTYANTHAELADVIPIWSFVALYVMVIIHRSTGENPIKTLRIALIVVGSIGAVFWATSGDVVTSANAHDRASDRFNGSLQYLPALAALVVFSGLTVIRGHPARYLVSTATAMFLLSLTMRTIDLRVCEITSIGTHFLWHILNAGMVGFLLIALVRHYPSSHHAGA